MASDLSFKAVTDEALAHLTVQHELAAAWRALAEAESPGVSLSTEVHVLPSIQRAVENVEQQARANEAGVDVLVAGSLHLVGGVFEAAGLTFAL